MWGLAVINAGTLLKVVWSVTFGGAAGWASLAPSVFTLAVTDAALLFAMRLFRRRRERAGGTKPRRRPEDVPSRSTVAATPAAGKASGKGGENER